MRTERLLLVALVTAGCSDPKSDPLLPVTEGYLKSFERHCPKALDLRRRAPGAEPPQGISIMAPRDSDRWGRAQRAADCFQGGVGRDQVVSIGVTYDEASGEVLDVLLVGQALTTTEATKVFTQAFADVILPLVAPSRRAVLQELNTQDRSLTFHDEQDSDVVFAYEVEAPERYRPAKRSLSITRYPRTKAQ